MKPIAGTQITCT